MPTAVPISDTISGTWAPSTGASLFGTIDESVASDVDFISSSVSPNQADFSEVKFGALSDPLSSTGHVVSYRYKKSQTSGEKITLTVRLVQGTNVIATWVHQNIDAITTAAQTLTAAQADKITDYSDLRIRFEAFRQPDAPVAPATANYTIPGGATSVSTQAALETAIAGGAQDIVVENGSYVRTGPLNIGNKRLWARSVGGVTLNYGIDIGGSIGSGGGQLHGFTQNISTSSQLAGGGVAFVSVTGTAGVNTTLTDLIQTGSGLPDGVDGVRVISPNGLIVQRLDVNTVTGCGLRVSDGVYNSTAVITTITDIDVDTARYGSPGASAGASECGLRIGHRVTNPVTRIKTRNTGWAGIATTNAATTTTISHFDIDSVAVGSSLGGYGVWVSNNSRLITFDTFTVGPTLSQGFRLEGDYGQAYGLSATTVLPASTITVNEPTTNAASSGTLYVGNPDGTISTVTYTGKTSNSFTGCSGGSGTYPSGTIVSVGGTVNATSIPGGPAAYKIVMRNGTVDAAAGTGNGFYLDAGVMIPTISNVSIVRYISGVAIVDKTGNPSVDLGGISNLIQSGNKIAPAETVVGIGQGQAGFPLLVGMH